MELLNYIFRLGVVFAIFGFLFGIFELGLRILTAGRKKTEVETYAIKFIKYLFLVDVSFMFCMDPNNGFVSNYYLVITALTLLVYFVGKLQNNQQQQLMFKQFGQLSENMPQFVQNFNIKSEIIIILLSILIFIAFIFFPNYASNPIALWFHDSIINIEDTPVFGFIFKVIGFFFMINMLMKMINAIIFIMSGKAFLSMHTHRSNERKDNDDFDDFEEIK